MYLLLSDRYNKENNNDEYKLNRLLVILNNQPKKREFLYRGKDFEIKDKNNFL